MYIYRVTNKVNGDFYVGKTTKSLIQRLNGHFYRAKHGSKTKLHNAMRKYGFSNFEIEPILSNVLEENLNSEEIRLISELNPTYNMTIGGDGGDTSKSINYKKNHKINCLRGERHSRFGLSKENNPNFGSKRTKESKNKMSKTHLQIREIRRKTCEHCNKNTDLPNYSRWHGDNCKFKD